MPIITDPVSFEADSVASRINGPQPVEVAAITKAHAERNCLKSQTRFFIEPFSRNEKIYLLPFEIGSLTPGPSSIKI